jgi:mycofactocin precursor
MSDSPTATAGPASPATTGEPGHVPAEDALVEEDVLVEEVSIDGMCGVY